MRRRKRWAGWVCLTFLPLLVLYSTRRVPRVSFFSVDEVQSFVRPSVTLSSREVETIRDLSSFGNTAALPSLLYSNELLLAMRTSKSRENHGRWGRHMSFGKLALPLRYETHHARSENIISSLCVSSSIQTGDVRPFYVRTRNSTVRPCFITTFGIPPANTSIKLLCLGNVYDVGRTDNLCQGSIEFSVDTRLFQQHMRNIVSVVKHGYQPWVEGGWFLFQDDGVGPVVFHVSMRDLNPGDILSVDDHFYPRSCESFIGWRGSTPLVQVDDYFWVALVHQWTKVNGTSTNQLGRQYRHRVMVMMSDQPGLLPTKCATSFVSTPVNFLSTDPFFFPTGLVHESRRDVLGLKGVRHSFLVSGGINDFVPSFAKFTLTLKFDMGVNLESSTWKTKEKEREKEAGDR